MATCPKDTQLENLQCPCRADAMKHLEGKLVEVIEGLQSDANEKFCIIFDSFSVRTQRPLLTLATKLGFFQFRLRSSEVQQK